MVSVIIPNYNGSRYLRICLDSLRQQIYRNFEVIVVDDGSNDDSPWLLSTEYPEVKVIPLSNNRGFSSAVNRGITEAKGQLLALLNNDAEADPIWLAALVTAANEHAWADFFASKMLQFSQRDVLDGAGDGYLRFGGSRRIGHGELDHGQYDELREILGACAGAAMYRRRLFDSIGPFDEDFIAFHEDMDLSLRAQWAGLRCLYVPTARVYHVGGGTTAPSSPLSVRLAAQNRWNVSVKNLPRGLLLRSVPLMLLAETYRMTRAVRWGTGVAYFRGLLSALRLLPAMLRKRSEVLRKAHISGEEFVSRIRRSDREAVESMIRSGAYSPAITRLLRWYLSLACRASPVERMKGFRPPRFDTITSRRLPVSQTPRQEDHT